MSGQEGQNEEVLELRAQVAEYERIFASAAPRLAAFKRLEEIARERKTVPEAVAAEAAIEVMKREQLELQQQAQQLAAARDAVEGEVATLLEKQRAAVEALDELKVEHADIHQEVGAILDDLDLLREDAVRLMGERSELELHVRALGLELAHLEKRRSSALNAETEASVPAADVDDRERRQESSGHAVPGKHDEFDLGTDDEHEESRLFDQFFHADVEHDKARDWILG